MGKIVLGYWDCPYCGQKQISGALRECTGCGNPRDGNTKFYTDAIGTARVVDNETARTVRARGKDWKCEYCGSLNSGLESQCKGCGGERPSASDNHSNVLPCDANIPRPSPPMQQTRAAIRAYRTKQKTITAIICFVLLAVLCALGIYALMPKDVQMRITDMSWEYTINIEEYKTVQESDWNIPPGGRMLYTRSEVHHYDKVIDHYEERAYQEIDYYEDVVVGYKDLENGYFEEITERQPVYKTVYRDEPVYRDKPVYRTKYYYEIERWKYARSVATSGHDKSPYWGEINLSEKEREGSKSQKYRITGCDENDKIYECTVAQGIWDSHEIDDVITGKITVGKEFIINDS